MTQKNEPLITALYERLSRDDDQQGDSNSIVNQKSYLTSYAADHGHANCRHYTDDGYSGGNFERPGWTQLIADIDAGLVGVVIAKDLSRVGRDYIQTGFYTEVYFRRKGWKTALEYLDKERFMLDYQMEDIKEEVRRLEVVKREFIQENKRTKPDRYAR